METHSLNATLKSKKLLARFNRQLDRGTIVTCADWACKRRVMGEPFKGPWTFDYHPWLYEPHVSTHKHRICRKGAQLGFTEWAINEAFYAIDHYRKSVLYCLPTRGNANDFSASRFDNALEESEYIRDIFSGTNNVGLKKAGAASLYIRGSKSRNDLKSIPVGLLILDEIDEMPEESVSLVEHRKDGQKEGSTSLLKLSTPTLPGFGIDKEYEESNKGIFSFKCPSCSKLIDLDYPRNFELCGDSLDDDLSRSRIFCHECNATLPHASKIDYLKPKAFGGTAHYVFSKQLREKEGFSTNQLYSMAEGGTPIEWAKAIIHARTSKTREQELYNSKAGKAHIVSGAKIEWEQINDCKGGYSQATIQITNRPRTMGVDVGNVFHVTIDEWDERFQVGKPNQRYEPRLIKETTTGGGAWDVREVISLFNEYQCHALVIDGEPERRIALQLLELLGSCAWMCDYSEGLKGGDVKIDEVTGLVQVNRTNWLDIVTGRFMNGSGQIPYDVSDEFCDHIQALVRCYKEDRWGQPVGRYVSNGPDHFAHSRVYSEVALPFALHQSGEDIYELF